MWPDRRLTDLLGIEHPVIQAPMAGPSTPEVAAAVSRVTDDGTALTNVFTGRPARGIVNQAMREIGPISEAAPLFPHAATSMAPLRTAAETLGSDDFTPLWSGQSARLGRAKSTSNLTRGLASDTLAKPQGVRR
jgi:nitronate monooxygenase